MIYDKDGAAMEKIVLIGGVAAGVRIAKISVDKEITVDYNFSCTV
mgnify:CR=1 FL=1